MPKTLQMKTALKTTTFNFSGNGLTGTGASALIQAVSDIGTVTDLDLSNNRIGRLGTESLVKYLKSKGKDTLRKLSLKGNRLGDKWVKLVLNAAENCNALEELNIADNAMRSATALSTFLCSGNNEVQQVDISWNGLRGSRVVADLNKGLTNGNCHIKQLRLAYNGFGAGDRDEFLVATIADAPSCTQLDISYNVISSSMVLAFVNILFNGDTMFKTLNLNGNPIGNLGARSVLSAICANDNISISLKHCQLDATDGNKDGNPGLQ